MNSNTPANSDSSRSSRRPYTTGFTVCTSIILCIVLLIQSKAQATDAILIGGGSGVHDAHIHFENSLRWKRSILSEQEVTSTVYFNDGDHSAPDISFVVDESNDEQTTTALSRVFGNAHWQKIRYRNHLLNNVEASTNVVELTSAISAKLSDESANELLFVHTGRGGYTGGTEDNAYMKLWGNSRLNVNQLHRLIQESNKSVRFVFSQSHSGGFHRLAYKNSSSGLELSRQTHCGFTSTSAYQKAETDIANLNLSDYPNYGAYFFSAFSGYEYNGEIISRFSDFDEDGQTSLREAHLFSLLEGKSIDLPLSTSEDYLLHWQPWYLRWQPAQNTPPNNEYTRIFRDLASQLDVPLTNNVAIGIRSHIRRQNLKLKELEQQHREQSTAIALLQASLQSKAYAQWPQLRAPYTSGFEELVRSGQLSDVNTFLENEQPEYPKLVTLIMNAAANQATRLQNNREMSQFTKLLHLRHLALLKGQLYAHGSVAQINDYQALVACEEAPLQATLNAVTVSEESTQ